MKAIETEGWKWGGKMFETQTEAIQFRLTDLVREKCKEVPDNYGPGHPAGFSSQIPPCLVRTPESVADFILSNWLIIQEILDNK